MKKRLLVVAGALASAALIASPVRGWQVSPDDHAKHHPEAPPAAAKEGMNMMASDAKLDELVKKMNAAQGQAKVDAMAELLTALVQTHQSMHGNMSHMMSMMQKMGGAAGK